MTLRAGVMPRPGNPDNISAGITIMCGVITIIHARITMIADGMIMTGEILINSME